MKAKPQAKIIAILLEDRTSNKFTEIINNKLKGTQFKEFKKEDALIAEYTKKALPNYLLLDPKKVTEKTLLHLKEKSPNQIVILVKLDNDQEDYTSKFKEVVPTLIVKVINKTASMDLFEQVILEADLENVKLSDNSNSTTTEVNNNSNDQSNNNDYNNERRYKFIKLLGSGQEGVVNLFEDTKEKRLIAMKTVKMNDIKEEIKIKMREKEELAQSLKSPTMIEFYESTEDEQNRYVKMEFASGGTLNEFIRSLRLTGESLTADEILNWFTQILIALKVLHNSKISHRDIKPDNILLCENPKATTREKKHMIAKISDLGISKIMENTGKHTVIGTLHYVAPEIISDADYNTSVDIWSLAVLLYEITMRKKPFDNLEEKILRVEIKENNVQDTLPITVDYRIRYLLHNLLSKNPKSRLLINEIFALNFIREKVENLLTIFPDWFEKYPVFKEIIAIKPVQCPYEPNFLSEEDSKTVNLIFKIIENCTCTTYKKSLLSQITNSYVGKDIQQYLEDTFNSEEQTDVLVSKVLNSLIENDLLVNLSNPSSREFSENDYYVFSCDNKGYNYDNPSFGKLVPVKKQFSLHYLSEHLMIIAEDLKSDLLNENKQLEISDPKYIEFLYGLSLLQNYNLLDEKEYADVDEKHAFLLNLYQVMFVLNLVKEKLEVVKKRGLISKLIKNEVGVNLKFNDCYLNNLELRHGIFRGNKKPIENYLRICSSNDPRFEVLNGIRVEVFDFMIVNELMSLESFTNESYLLRKFTGKNLEYQINQYIVDFSNTCVQFDSDQIVISPLYFKYFELDLGGAKGLFTEIHKALHYNDSKEHVIFKVRNVDANKIEDLKSVNKLVSKIKSGAVKLVFDY